MLWCKEKEMSETFGVELPLWKKKTMRLYRLNKDFGQGNQDLNTITYFPYLHIL